MATPKTANSEETMIVLDSVVCLEFWEDRMKYAKIAMAPLMFLVAVFAIICARTDIAVAQSKQIRAIVAYPPGSGADIIARYYANKIKELSSANVIVENRVGANAHIATLTLMKSKPDGQTILMHSTGAVLGNPLMMSQAQYDPLKDLDVAAMMSEGAFVLAVKPDSDIKGIEDLLKLIHAKFGNSSYGSANSSSLISSRLMLRMKNLTAVEVSYKSSADVLQDLRAGLIDFAFVDSPLAVAQIRAGRARVIATTGRVRNDVIPDVPSMIEAGFTDYEYTLLFGIWLPKGTAPEVRQQYNEWVNQINRMEETVEFSKTSGGARLLFGSVSDMQGLMEKTYERWQKIVKTVGIAPN